MKKYVWCTFEFEGFHSWKNAPVPVSFLKNKHRHMFKGKVTVAVTHDDRDIEFILLKRDCLSIVQKALEVENLGSCEMIGEVFVNQLKQKYKDREIIVDISEDGENGATVQYDGGD